MTEIDRWIEGESQRYGERDRETERERYRERDRERYRDKEEERQIDRDRETERESPIICINKLQMHLIYVNVCDGIFDYLQKFSCQIQAVNLVLIY